MSTLDVPGARLRYDIAGSGPLLVLVPGAGSRAEDFRPLAGWLGRHYTVLCYERESTDAEDAPERRLAADAEGIRRLIEHVSDEPAYVFATLAGAVAGLRLLADRPYLVRALAAHEPTAFQVLLPDGERWTRLFLGLYERYRQAGPAAAAGQAQRFERDLWLERELRRYPQVELDLGLLEPYRARILPCYGSRSRAEPTFRAAAVLAEQLGVASLALPGDRLGYATHPQAFAETLAAALRALRG